MQYNLLKNAVSYFKQLYSEIEKFSRTAYSAFNPISRLEFALESALHNYSKSGGSYGEIKYPLIPFSKFKSGWSHLRSKELHEEITRAPNHVGVTDLFGGDSIKWEGIEDSYQKALLVIEASRLDKDDPRYKKTKRPSSEDKAWARDFLRNPVEPATIDEVVNDSNGQNPTS